MKNITLGSTGITTVQNAFGALPAQRVSVEEAVSLFHNAYNGGMRFFDTARAYSDSEKKLGIAFKDMRDKVFIATKTGAKTPDAFWKDLETSLKTLQTDYIDIYQFHQAQQVYRPGDGTGMYECMLEAKRQGKIRHIGITAHLIQVAFDAVHSGLYETLQFPFSYLASEKEIQLVKETLDANMGFICMKGLAGGLITRSDVAMAFMTQFDVMPIWGIQKQSELDEWLSYMDETPSMTEEMKAYIQKEHDELSGEFCRGCGYCMPTCPKHIQINNCARMSLMLRRAPSSAWLNDYWQQEMKRTEECINCRLCVSKCPYGLDTPALLKKNYEDYKRVLAGEVKVQ
ncbi:MAG: aldo/keto reductase [Erysipelotrichaceae bacterium]|nr:aldo/keto reductase [Erysipelotrichaceae bacterium]